MQTLSDVREALRTRNGVAHYLRLADKYLTDQASKGVDFILPFEHREILPILARFANDDKGWYRFVKIIRDDIPRTDAEFGDVRDFCRTLDIRITQTWRRKRLNAAVAMAIEKGIIPADKAELKIQYAKRCQQVWGLARAQALSEARLKVANGRVSSSEQESVLQDFWEAIDSDITQGRIPEL